MTSSINLETPVTLRQAYLVMFAFLDQYWEQTGKPDELGGLLGNLSLWETENGQREPMDAAVFPDWISCAQEVLAAESSPDGFRRADISIDGKPPSIKVKR